MVFLTLKPQACLPENNADTGWRSSQRRYRTSTCWNLRKKKNLFSGPAGDERLMSWITYTVNLLICLFFESTGITHRPPDLHSQYVLDIYQAVRIISHKKFSSQFKQKPLKHRGLLGHRTDMISSKESAEMYF